jgi:CheY-like chemotaxis protein
MKHILVIDKALVARVGLALLLLNTGKYCVVTAGRPSDAMCYILDWKPDLVICNNDLGDNCIKGNKLLSLVQQQYSIPGILYTEQPVDKEFSGINVVEKYDDVKLFKQIKLLLEEKNGSTTVA